MHKTVSFWRTCAANAARGSSPFANDWQWAIGNPTIAAISPAIAAGLSAWLGKEYMMAEHPILGPLVIALGAYALTWLFALAVRTIRAAPLLYYAEKQRADALDARNLVPQVEIVSSALSTIEERLPHETEDNAPGIFVVFRNVKVINRDDRRASLDFSLQINLGPEGNVLPKTFLRLSQINPWQEAALQPEFRLPAGSIPSLLNIDARTTVDGYFAFFQPYPVDDLTSMLVRMADTTKASRCWKL